MALRFNPPPGWPAPPAGFVPGPGWQPGPDWPPAPSGWQFWVPDDAPGDATAAASGPQRNPAGDSAPGITAAAADGEPGTSADGAPRTSAESGYWLPESPAATSYGQPSATGWPVPAPPPAGTSGLAIAAFVLGLLGFLAITAILGIVFGAVALGQIRRSLQGGKTLAILGIVFGAGWLLLLAVAIAIGAAVGASFTAGTSNAPGDREVAMTSIVTGDCFNLPTSAPAQGVMFVEQTPCNQPHNAQVFSTFAVSGSSLQYPGATRLGALADRGCNVRVKGQLNSAQMTGSMIGRFLYPLANSWHAGNRTITCVVYSPTSMTSSVLKR